MLDGTCSKSNLGGGPNSPIGLRGPHHREREGTSFDGAAHRERRNRCGKPRTRSSRELFPPKAKSAAITPPACGRRRRGGRGVRMGRRPHYWLLKTEPGEWSWQDQQRSAGGVAPWDGVRNRQAQKNLKAMAEGDLCFFYHSGPRPSERRIVGVVEVVKPWYSSGGDDGAVDVRAVGEMTRSVGLKEIKEEPGMAGFALVRQPRLSVVPVPEGIWQALCEMGGGFGGEGNKEEEEGQGEA